MVRRRVTRLVLVSVLAVAVISLWPQSSEAGRWFDRHRPSSGYCDYADQRSGRPLPWYIYRFPDDTVKVVRASLQPGSVKRIVTNEIDLVKAEKFINATNLGVVNDSNWFVQKCGTGTSAWYWIVHATTPDKCTPTSPQTGLCHKLGSYSILKYISDNAVLSTMSTGSPPPCVKQG